MRSITEIIEEYGIKWHEHVLRMEDDRIPKAILKYRPIGSRSVGLPIKQWSDQLRPA